MGAWRISVSSHTKATVTETFVATPLEELHSLQFAAVSKLPINQCLCANYDS